MRTLVALTLLAACGGAAPPTAAPGARAPLPLPPATPEAEPCEAQIEDAPPGNHDRVAFEAADGAYGYKNLAGEPVIAPRFAFAYEFGEAGLAAAVERPTTPAGKPRFVFIDPRGVELAQAYAFDNGPDYFQEGLARIVGADGRVGFIDRGGAIVIAPRFVDATGFCHGQAMVHDGHAQWTIDRAGAAVGPRRPYVPAADPCGD